MAGNRTSLAFLLFILFFSTGFPAQAERSVKVGVSGSFALGASIPKGRMWDVEPRASVGFPLSAALRVAFGHSATEPMLMFVPCLVDTGTKGGSNGRFLSGLFGFRVYPYNILFIRPYFMAAAGYGEVTYKGPCENYPAYEGHAQKGTGRGAAVLVGGGVDFNLYEWFSIGPTFFWNPVWWFDCTRKIQQFEDYASWPCNPEEDHWILTYWFVGLRVKADFAW